MLDILSLARPRRELDLPADFTRRLAEIRPPRTALVISTHPLELAGIDHKAERPGAGAAVTAIDVGSPELDQYFKLGT
jgi:hypothetical protein